MQEVSGLLKEPGVQVVVLIKKCVIRLVGDEEDVLCGA